MPRATRIGLLVALMAVALTLSAAMVTSAAPVRFGAKLNKNVQPQPALWCDEPNDSPPHANCTWIMNEALSRPSNGHRAPKAGVIAKVRLMSCDPGKLRIQVARQVKGTSKFKIVRNGPAIAYQGDPQGCGDDDDFVYKVESFATSFKVSKGDRIAIRAKRTGTLRCGGGGDNTWLFDPPLVAGGAARKPGDSQGCLLLVEWQYR